TNTSGYTNVAFAVFGAASLSGISPRYPTVPNVRNVEADVDLYVSKDPELINLDPLAIENSLKSLERGGSELIVISNNVETPNEVYYIGVKSEDQRAADYGILALASEQPFAAMDADGNMRPLFFPLPSEIKDGTPDNPGRADLFGVIPFGGEIRRVVVTNAFEHQRFGDLVGVLYKQGLSKYAVLNNHNHFIEPGYGVVTNIYNDLDEGDTPGAVHSDGPGSLADFAGERARGLWTFTVTDNTHSQTGSVLNFQMWIERQPTNNVNNGGSEIVGERICRLVYPGNARYHVVDVPRAATNLTLNVEFNSGTGPIEVYIRRGRWPTGSRYDYQADVTSPGGQVSIGLSDTPPLRPGRYYIVLYNPTASVADICWWTRVGLDFSGAAPITYTETGEPPSVDDAVTRSVINVPDKGLVSEVQVGIRLDHPRLSDLSIRLVSPQRTRVLLFENRGGLAATSLGMFDEAEEQNIFAIFTENTNFFPEVLKFAQPPFGTNASGLVHLINQSFETAADGGFGGSPGLSVSGSASVFTDTDLVYAGNKALQLDGTSTITGTFPTHPGRRYVLRFLYRTPDGVTDSAPVAVTVNGGTAELLSTDEAWQTFTTNFIAEGPDATFEIAAPTDAIWLDLIEVVESASGQYYLPEESLGILTGQKAQGNWTLELWDTRAGEPIDTSSLEWQLEIDLLLDNPMPVVTTLTNGVPYVDTVKAEDVRYFMIHAPLSAGFATNMLTSVNGVPLDLLFRQNGLPLTPGGFTYSLFTTIGTAQGSETLQPTGTAPTFQPGQRYYLAVRNQDTTDLPFELKVEFDQTNSPPLAIPTLVNNVEYPSTIAAGNVMQYFQFIVSPEALTATFEILNATGDVDLYIRYGGPLPTYFSHHYNSQKAGTGDELIVVSSGSLPVNLGPGTWYIGVLNRDTASVDYEVKAREYFLPDFTIIDLTPGVPVSGISPSGPLVTTFYRFEISQDNPSAWFEIFDLDGDVDLFARRGAFPTPSTYDAAYTEVGDEPEFISITKATFPPTLNGTWYLGVFNKENFDVNYTILADVAPVPPSATNIIQLISGVPTNGVAATGNTLTNFYSFVIDQTNSSVLFELFNLTGNADLLVRKDNLPSLTEYDWSSTATGTANEQLVLSTNGAMPVLNGTWYLAVVNNEAVDVDFTIHAVVSGTNGVLVSGQPLQIISGPTIEGNSVKFEWNSVPGQTYEVQVSTDLITWTTEATVTATASVYEYISAPIDGEPMRFYRIVQVPAP
ncbi:MAG: proprotein convertase P-domain-containing protein, partial [Limisphaerales bacterium]